MIFGILADSGQIMTIEKRFADLSDARGRAPDGYLEALVPLPEDAVLGAYFVNGILRNRPGKEEKYAHPAGLQETDQ